MYIQSGMVKANKKDIEDIKVFLRHAEHDISLLSNGYFEGTYTHLKDSKRAINKGKKEIEAGKRGIDNIKMMLRGLCDKWE